MQNFLADIIDADLASGKHTHVITRFPPEPNGYLHIGHAKSICLNFGLAQAYGGRCHLRMDDTNPTTEDIEYVEAIQRDVKWLGFDWGEHLYFASDYYERLFQHAVELIERDKAYVCEVPDAEFRRTYRGSITEPGKHSPYRDRPIAESLALFARMRAGEIAEGAAVVRAKIDMASPNMKMRDPAIYRIKKEHHYRTGDAWCIYPLYDFTHCLSDAYERITHSICTLEFENNRELYDWVLDNVTLEHRPLPRQYEFARLNLSYTVMSKRKLLQLVEEKYVNGWDDPRMPTLAGMRRRGITPGALRAFCDMIGVAKNNSTVDIGKLEFCIRSDLNPVAPRVMGVLRPLKVVLENYPAEQSEELDAPFFPPDVGKPGSRLLPMSREIYIERDDFMEAPPKKFFRLSPGREVRLRYGYIIRCDAVVKDAAGNIVELHCTYDEKTRGGETDRKVQGTIHWVSARHAVAAKVRLYDRLFHHESPEGVEHLNPVSLVELDGCMVEPGAAGAGERVQFERQGYFCLDPDSRPGAPIYNRIVTLRDTWAKLQEAPTQERGTKAEAPKKDAPKKGASVELSAEARARADRYVADGVPARDAERIAQNDRLASLYDQAAAAPKKAVANWLVNDVAAALGNDAPRFTGADLAELIALIDRGTISATIGKEVLVEMLEEGKKPSDIVARRGLEQLGSEGLVPLIERVVADHPEEAARYRSGKTNLIGFFLGKLMKASEGRANPKEARALLEKHLAL